VPTEFVGGVQVVEPLIATDPVVDLDRVGRGLLGWVEGDDFTPAGGDGQVLGEGGDAAATRRVG